MGNQKFKLFFLPAVSLLVVFACTIPSPENVNNIQETQPILNTQSVPIATTQLPTDTATVILATATVTATPTITYTPTSSIPMVTVSVGTNCREGPGKIYNLLDGLMVGEQAEIVKLAPAGGSCQSSAYCDHTTSTHSYSYFNTYSYTSTSLSFCR